MRKKAIRQEGSSSSSPLRNTKLLLLELIGQRCLLLLGAVRFVSVVSRSLPRRAQSHTYTHPVQYFLYVVYTCIYIYPPQTPFVV